MRAFIAIAFLFVSSVTFAQTSFVKDASAKLDKALLNKDTVTLKQIVHIDATYGHSNGWVETREDMIKDLATGKLAYKKIENKDVKWAAGKDWASMRCTSEVKVSMNGTDLDLKLHVLQVWLKTNKGWQLIARQSTKLS